MIRVVRGRNSIVLICNAIELQGHSGAQVSYMIKWPISTHKNAIKTIVAEQQNHPCALILETFINARREYNIGRGGAEQVL